MANSAEVNRRYYLANKEKVAFRNKQNKARNRAYIKSVKESSPCQDCGNFYPSYVMDFDHLEDKLDNVSTLANSTISLERLQTEVAKCDLVCANCHRIRTHVRRS